MNSFVDSYTPFDALETGREYYIFSYDGYKSKKYKGTFHVYRYSRMSGDRYIFAWFHNLCHRHELQDNLTRFNEAINVFRTPLLVKLTECPATAVVSAQWIWC